MREYEDQVEKTLFCQKRHELFAEFITIKHVLKRVSKEVKGKRALIEHVGDMNELSFLRKVD